jgi:hypothetical protein
VLIGLNDYETHASGIMDAIAAKDLKDSCRPRDVIATEMCMETG